MGAPSGVLSLGTPRLPGGGETHQVLPGPWSWGEALGLNWVVFHLLLLPLSSPFLAFCRILPSSMGHSGVLVALGGHGGLSANPLFSSLLTWSQSKAGHDQEKPNPDTFALAPPQDPAERVPEECGCWGG